MTKLIEKESLLIDIGLRMQAVRKHLGFKQQNFAKELGISPASLSEIEAGRAKPMFDTIFNLTKKFNVNVFYLLHGQGDMFAGDEIARSIEPNKYGAYTEWLKNFLYYFYESDMVKFAMMGYFKKIMVENGITIEQEINSAKKIQTKNRPPSTKTVKQKQLKS